MAKLTKSAAARHLHISRTTLYKLMEHGALSATPDGMIDTAELVRVAPLVDTLKERTRTSMDTAPIAQEQSQGEQVEHLVDSVHEQPWTDVHGRAPTSTIQDLVDTVRTQMQVMRDELLAAREERALLLQMLQDMQRRYDRLLEAPRPAAVSSPAPSAPAPASVPRGAMRRRIVALLREHPDGLSPAQTRRLLGSDKDLGSTMKAMARDGLLRRVAAGWYVAPEASTAGGGDSLR
jgi:hypothetical protein